MTPTRITLARTAALAQAAIAVACTVLAAAFTVAAFAADHAARRAGGLDDWAGFGEFLGAGVAVLTASATLLVAVPAVRLRTDRPGARYALIVGEVVTTAPIALLLIVGLQSQGQGLTIAAGVAWVVCAVLVLSTLAGQRRTNTVPSTPGPR